MEGILIWNSSPKKNIHSFFETVEAFNRNQINLLRKTGQLDLALVQAQELYQSCGHFITLAWVCYDLWKVALDKSDWTAIEEIREKVFSMNISEDQLLRKQMYWLIVKTGFKALKMGVAEGYIQAQLEGMTLHRPIGESQLIHALLQLSSKLRLNWNNYLFFNNWVGIEHVTEPEMLERTIIPIAKALLEMPIQPEKTSLYQFFFEWIKKTSLTQKGLFYVNYYYVKLLLRERHLLEAKTQTMALIEVKPCEFWVWQLLANCLIESPDLRYSAYCKALSCGGKAEMLLGLRQEFAGFLIHLHRWNQARYELDCIEQVRKKNNWAIPSFVQMWCNLPKICNASSEQTEYVQQSLAIEQTIWNNSQILTIVVTEINTDNQFAHFWTENQTGGKVNLKKIRVDEIVLGTTYEAIHKQHPTKGYLEILQLRKSDNPARWCKFFEGVLRVLPSGIGFCGEVFVNMGNVTKNELNCGDWVSGFAYETLDTKKQRMSWKAIKIKKCIRIEV